MDLINLRPKEVTFEINGLEITFRPFTIADDLKMQDICGGQKEMQAVFDKFDFERISLIGWYQLTLESQKAVLDKVQLGHIDPETGEMVESKAKPIDKFRGLFMGVGDQILLLQSLIKSKGLNIPELGDEELSKKFLDQLGGLSTGQSSTTP